MAKKMTEADKDDKHAIFVTGRHQIIPSKPAQEQKPSTLAAGAVLWRGTPGDLASLEFAVIHRPSYDDWSLAKGKVDPGESIPVTAVREIREETGYGVRLGKLVGKVCYPVAGRTKIVYYFTACVLDGEFTPNKEVDELRWLKAEQACDLLSYEVDTQVLDKAIKRLSNPTTTRLLFIRHAHAFPRQTWSGDDNLRPLDKKGVRQARYLPDLVATYHPSEIYSAEPDRCVATAKPIAEKLGLTLNIDYMFGDRAWLSRMKDVKARVTQLVDEGGTKAIVSQGLLIPDLIAWFSAKGTLPLDEIPCKKGGVWVLSFTAGELTGADYLASALPAK